MWDGREQRSACGGFAAALRTDAGLRCVLARAADASLLLQLVRLLTAAEEKEKHF